MRGLKQEVKRETAMRTSRIQKQLSKFTDAELKKGISNAKRRIKEANATYKDDICSAKAYRKRHSEYPIKFLPLAIKEMKSRRKKK